MVVEVFVLCDAANDSSGKMNLLGAFNTINAQRLPARHPFCILAVRLRADRPEAGAIQVRSRKPDGSQLIPPMTAPLNFNFTNPSEPSVANLFFGGISPVSWTVRYATHSPSSTRFRGTSRYHPTSENRSTARHARPYLPTPPL